MDATPTAALLKRDGDVRLCEDNKLTVNPCLVVPKYPLLGTEHLFATLHGYVKFSFTSVGHS